jgi:hypothetical protein
MPPARLTTFKRHFLLFLVDNNNPIVHHYPIHEGYIPTPGEANNHS